MIIAPCKDCADRGEDCHSRCEKYIKYRELKDKEAETITKNKNKYHEMQSFKIGIIAETKRKAKGGGRK